MNYPEWLWPVLIVMWVAAGIGTLLPCKLGQADCSLLDVIVCFILGAWLGLLIAFVWFVVVPICEALHRVKLHRPKGAANDC